MIEYYLNQKQLLFKHLIHLKIWIIYSMNIMQFLKTTSGGMLDGVEGWSSPHLWKLLQAPGREQRIAVNAKAERNEYSER